MILEKTTAHTQTKRNITYSNQDDDDADEECCTFFRQKQTHEICKMNYLTKNENWAIRSAKLHWQTKKRVIIFINKRETKTKWRQKHTHTTNIDLLTD